MAKSKKKSAPKKSGSKAQPKPKFVTLRNVDGVEMTCMINRVQYSGVEIKVPAEKAEGVKEVLVNAGYNVK